MKVVDREELPERQLLLQVEVEAEALGESFDKAYRRLASRTNIPGFRKGKAPRPVVERYLGREAILDEAIEVAVPQAYREALTEQEVEAFDSPQIEIVQKEPLIFKAVVPLRPTVELGDYKSLRTPPIPVEVTDDEVGEVLNQLRAGLSTWLVVERGADFQDRLQMDAVATRNGEPFLEQKGFGFIPVKGSMMPVPGFSEAILGVRAGEEKEFSLSFAADHEDPRLADSEFQFRVKAHQVEERQLPPVDDELAKRLGDQYQTLGELQEAIRKELIRNKENEARQRLEEEVLARIIAEATVEFPPVLVQDEVNHLLREEDARFRDRGDRLDLFLRRVGKTEEELRAEAEPVARERIRRALVINKAGETEATEVTEADVDAEVERMAEANPAQADEVRRAFGQEAQRHSLMHSLYNQKVLDRLVEIALQDETKDEATAVEAATEATPTKGASGKAGRRKRK